jgi:ABC-type branched-subunit amino acid transport system substrate-binding protein
MLDMLRTALHRRLNHAAAALCTVVAAQSFAQGVTDGQVTIGQTVALSGGMGEHGQALAIGAQAYLQKVNRGGGIHGRKLVLVTLDDGADAKRAEANARRLASENGVVALFSGAEGGPCVAATRVAAEARVPMIGCAGGSPELREPFNAFSFPVRAAHVDEFDQLLGYAAMFGMKRIGFVHSDSDTGRKHLANVRRLAEQHGVTLALAVTLSSAKDGFDPERIAAEIAKNELDALLNHGSYAQYAEIIRATRKRRGGTQFLAVNSGAQQMVRALGGESRGLIFAQVVPFPWFDATPVVREYREALKAHAPTVEVSFSSLEGFINAKVLVEALRRADRKLTRESLVAALESMRGYDVGGLAVTFTARDHQGSRFVDVVVVGADGRFVR